MLKRVLMWILLVAMMMIGVPFLLVQCRFPEQKDVETPDMVRVYIHTEDRVEEMNFEEYIEGVVAAEMPASFENEALKAQAVAARSYTLSKIAEGMQERHHGADICTDYTHCQSYISFEAASKAWGSKAEENWNKICKAVEDTKGMIMTYQGNPVCAVFHSSSGGRTENAADVWGRDIPYLKSTDSPGEEASPTFHSEVRITVFEFRQKILSACPQAQVSDINHMFGYAHRSTGGDIKDVDIGGHVFGGGEIRDLFSLHSTDFSMRVEDNTVIFAVTGNGHGVGMSQYGANYMAQQGADYQTILKAYYTGVSIEKRKMTD